MGNQPAYRNRNQPSGGWGILVPFFAAMIFIIWPYTVWHGCKYGGQDLSGCGAESEWVWNARSWAACGIWWGLLAGGFAAAVVAGGVRRRSVPPKGRLRVEATEPGEVRPPAPPVCVHLGAVRVGGHPRLAPDVTVENWCPGCGAQLGAGFRWVCCGAAPGDAPGEGHLCNCVNRKEQAR